jgi:hypothetical protein
VIGLRHVAERPALGQHAVGNHERRHLDLEVKQLDGLAEHREEAAHDQRERRHRERVFRQIRPAETKAGVRGHERGKQEAGAEPVHRRLRDR